MRDVVVAGIGQTKYGMLWDYSLRDLAALAVIEALDSNAVDKIDSIYTGNFSAGTFVEQEHIGALVADYTGFVPLSSTRVENACASGAVAFRTAFNEIASGFSDVCLVLGIEKMSDVVTSEAVYSLSLAGDREYEGYQGVTFPALFALVAKSYMHEFNMPRRALSQVSVKNHENAYSNPKAQFKRKITLEDVENATMIADPLTLLDCSPISDGASAVILMSLDKAKELNVEKPIRVAGIAQASDTLALAHRDSFVSFGATVEAAKKAYKMASKNPSDIDFLEVHDCFTIAEITAIEDLGFYKKGDGFKAVLSGELNACGKLPVNTSGGLKAKGHPVGATGVGQIITLTEQLRGIFEGCALKNPKSGLAHNLGGSGSSVVVTILEVI